MDLSLLRDIMTVLLAVLLGTVFYSIVNCRGGIILNTSF